MEKQLTPPAQAQKFGMNRLTFYDDFDSTDTIDLGQTGKSGFNWYADRPFNGIPFTAPEFKIENSVLTFIPLHCSHAIGLPSYSKKGDTGFTFRYGYAEAKLRFKTSGIPAEGRDGVMAFWAHSVTDFMGRKWEKAGELDIFEGIPHERVGDDYTKTFYSGTLHEHLRREGEKTIYASNLINSTGYNDNFEFLDDDWHTYGAAWDKGIVEWYLDNKLMHSARYAPGKLPEYFYKDDPTPLPRLEDTRPEFAERTWVGAHNIMEEEDLVLFLGTHKTWPMEVDWVRVWQK